MRATLLALTGPLKGRKINVFPGQIWRRLKGAPPNKTANEVLLDDTLVSSHHAEVKVIKDSLWLVDLGSKNKIKQGGQSQERIEIKPGALFMVGSSQFQVITAPSNSSAPNWPEELLGKLNFAYWLKQWPHKRLKPFPHPISLILIDGPSRGQSWHMAFGPRQVGPGQLDFHLNSPELPQPSFIIDCDSQGVFLLTSCPELVCVNNQSSDKCRLFGGEVIQAGLNTLKVEFLSHGI